MQTGLPRIGAAITATLPLASLRGGFSRRGNPVQYTQFPGLLRAKALAMTGTGAVNSAVFLKTLLQPKSREHSK